MKEIRAFVGHSFTEDDAEVVRVFLKLFDQLSGSHPNFIWEHAEAAEPKILAEKVKRLFADKNVFIGICTRKEAVVRAGSLKSPFLRSRSFKAAKSDLSWKTSDWIIQEIGFATANGLDLILLIEDGVRRPGGIQGDVEYIEFERRAPEKSLGKILEMLKALSPKAATTSSSVSIPSQSSQAKKEEADPSAEDWTTPKPEWKRADYELAFLAKVVGDNPEEAKRISDAYLASDEARSNNDEKGWKAHVEVVRLTYAKGGSFSLLKKLAEESPQDSEVLGHLAEGYEFYREHTEAAKLHETAARLARLSNNKLYNLLRAAHNYNKAKQLPDVLRVIDEGKALVKSDNAELAFLRALGDIAETSKETQLALGILERIVEIEPDDFDTRFKLALKHSECEANDLAMFHYLGIPYDKRGVGTWNNLGVAYNAVGLPAACIRAYRRAEEQGETLAMSNLARKFMDFGFLPEAQALCDKAITFKNYNKEIGTDIARIKEISESEEKKQSELLEKAEPVSRFYKQFGRAIIRVSPANIPSQWSGPDCVLNLEIKDSKFHASGSYEVKRGGLLSAVFSEPNTSTQPPKTLVQITYDGTLRGNAVEATVRRGSSSSQPTSILEAKDDPRALLFFSDDCAEIHVMEIANSGTRRFYKFMPVQPLPS